MRISAITRADPCGLATLSRMFHDNLGFCKTVSIARHQGGAWHSEWYGENNRQAPENGMTHELATWLCEGADVLLSFECWYGEFVPAIAKRLGVKTVLMPMYECCPTKEGGLEYTDLAICTSMLDLEEMTNRTPGLARAVKTFLPVPFDTQRIPFRRRERALTFVHNAGHGGIGGRNSTVEVLEAWQYVQSPAKLLVRLQPGMVLESPVGIPNDPRITAVESNPENYWDLWGEGDVLLHPHKWDGLSLPIQEATASGMPVMTTRYWPFCDQEDKQGWLPKSIQDIAIEPCKVGRRIICREIDVFYPHAKDIAAAVDRLWGENIEAMSDDARAQAERWSWSSLLPLYQEQFQSLVTGEPVRRNAF